MDISELKKLLDNSATVVVVDNDSPSFVVLKYDAYKNIISSQPQDQPQGVKNNNSQTVANQTVSSVAAKPGFGEEEMEILERINKDIQALKNELEKEEKVLTTEE